jgi:WD40 repeat protein
MLILEGPKDPVQSLAFSPDNLTLYASHLVSGVLTWDLATRTFSGLDVDGVRAIGSVRVYEEFALHPGGRWAFGRCRQPNRSISSTENTARAIDLENAIAWSFYFSAPRQGIAVSPCGSRITTIGHAMFDRERLSWPSVCRLYGWTLSEEGLKYVWHRDCPDNPEAIVHLGENLFVTADTTFGAGSGSASPPQLTVRWAETGLPQQAIAFAHQGEQLLASPDGRQFIARRGTTLHAWDTTDWTKPPTVVQGKLAKRLEPRAAAYHPSSRYLLLAKDSPAVIAFDTLRWKKIQAWNWKVGTLRAVTVSPDGTLAAAGSPRGTVVVWDLDL